MNVLTAHGHLFRYRRPKCQNRLESTPHPLTDATYSHQPKSKTLLVTRHQKSALTIPKPTAPSAFRRASKRD